MSLSLPTLTQLTAPTPSATGQPIGAGDLEIYKLDLKEYQDAVKHCKTCQQKIFPLVLGQCSHTVHDRIEAASNWSAVNEGSDVIELLHLIRQSFHNQVTMRKSTHLLIEAETNFFKFRQTDKMTNSEYLQKY